MKNKSVKWLDYNAICLFLALSLISVTSGAQSISRQVIGVAGGNATISSTRNRIQVSWTVGEPIVGKAVASNDQAQVTIGFQQSDPSILPPATNDKLLVDISPNPTPDLINVTLLDPAQRDLRLTLTNTSGQVLLPNVLIEYWKNEVDLSRLPPGIYYLNVFDQEATYQTYKIIKTK